MAERPSSRQSTAGVWGSNRRADLNSVRRRWARKAALSPDLGPGDLPGARQGGDRPQGIPPIDPVMHHQPAKESEHHAPPLPRIGLSFDCALPGGCNAGLTAPNAPAGLSFNRQVACEFHSENGKRGAETGIRWGANSGEIPDFRFRCVAKCARWHKCNQRTCVPTPGLGSGLLICGERTRDRAMEKSSGAASRQSQKALQSGPCKSPVFHL